MTNRIARVGDIIQMSSGYYDSYEVDGLFKVLRPFKPKDVLRDYLEKYPEQAEEYRFKHDQFLRHLLALELLEPIIYGILHTSSYSCAKYASFLYTKFQEE